MNKAGDKGADLGGSGGQDHQKNDQVCSYGGRQEGREEGKGQESTRFKAHYQASTFLTSEVEMIIVPTLDRILKTAYL